MWADPQDVGQIEQLIPDPGSRVLVYCGIGVRSAAVADMLRQRGYLGVTSLAGGIRRWRSEGRPVVEVDGQPEDRYDRHVRLDGFGRDGQDRIRDARVLVVGAGGLGSPVIQYLATAGVGTIGIVDGDRVDTTNLQRQVIFERAATSGSESPKRRGPECENSTLMWTSCRYRRGSMQRMLERWPVTISS